jgi:nucleoside-diphosphate-sugar epimerase
MTLRKDPLFKEIDTVLRKGVGSLGPMMEERLRNAIAGPLPVPKVKEKPINTGLSVQQLRGVYHECESAKSELGYEPLHSFVESMGAYRRWYIKHHGFDCAYKDLILELH